MYGSFGKDFDPVRVASVMNLLTGRETKMVLQVKQLQTCFFTTKGVVRAVDNVSFSLRAGTILGLVGESGSGKSTIGLSILRLIDAPGKITGGEILLDGNNLLNLSEKAMEEIRGKKLAMIMQNPLASLNSLMTIGGHFTETILSHEKCSAADAWEKGVSWLCRLGFLYPERVMTSYPFQLSMGMCQRVMLAIILALQPQILIADEPTSALDVALQAQIIGQIKILRRDTAAAILFITHDLDVAAELADQVAVMYAGSIIEYGEIVQIYDKPIHPYTKGLLQSRLTSGKSEITFFPNVLTNLGEVSGHQCVFAARCSQASLICREKKPALRMSRNGHMVACHLAPTKE